MTLYSVETVDVLLVTEGAKAVIDDIVHEVEFGISRAFFMVWQDEIELPDAEKGVTRLQRMSFINGRVIVDNF